MITITRKIAAWGCSALLVTSILALVVAVQNSIKWLMFCSIGATIIYSIGLGIVLYDYFKYG